MPACLFVVCGWDDMVDGSSVHIIVLCGSWHTRVGWFVPFFLGLVFVPVRGNSRVVCEL